MFSAGVAHRHKRMVEEYWAERGNHPKVWVELDRDLPEKSKMGGVYVVRSDMINGLPRDGE